MKRLSLSQQNIPYTAQLNHVSYMFFVNSFVEACQFWIFGYSGTPTPPLPPLPPSLSPGVRPLNHQGVWGAL